MRDALHGGDPAVMERLAEEALRVLRDPVHAEDLRTRGRDRARGLA